MLIGGYTPANVYTVAIVHIPHTQLVCWGYDIKATSIKLNSGKRSSRVENVCQVNTEENICVNTGKLKICECE